MLKRYILAAGLCAALVAFAAASDDPEGRMLPDPNTARLEEAPSLPSVNGKYRVLLVKIHVPQDEQSYGKFNDFGKYQATSYGGVNNVPEGYWVYVSPNWYVWRDCVRPNFMLPGGQPRPGGKATIPLIEIQQQGGQPAPNPSPFTK
jgi:hypothetical protein